MEINFEALYKKLHYQRLAVNLILNGVKDSKYQELKKAFDVIEKSNIENIRKYNSAKIEVDYLGNIRPINKKEIAK